MSTRSQRLVQAKPVFFVIFGLMTLFVLYRFEVPLMDSHSPVREHLRKVIWWLLPHGLGGALALLIAPFQFSSRLRQRHLRWHRLLGRLYVISVFVAAPMAIPVALLNDPGRSSLFMSLFIQSSGWLLTTAVALYCARTGNIQQHREWMIRSYPFAMIFVVTRTLFAVPAIAAWGEVGSEAVIWSCLVAACFVPSFVINWRAIFRRRPVAAEKSRAAG